MSNVNVCVVAVVVDDNIAELHKLPTRARIERKYQGHKSEQPIRHRLDCSRISHVTL